MRQQDESSTTDYLNEPFPTDYLGEDLADHTDGQCQFEVGVRGGLCGLPVWAGCTDRCEFHTAQKPHDIRVRLERVARTDANLLRAQLQDSDLRSASLRTAKLRQAHLQGADMRDADLRDADLTGVRMGLSLTPVTTGDDMVPVHTDIRGADLRGATLSEIIMGRETDLDDRTLFGVSSAEHGTAQVRDADTAVYRQLKLAFQDSGDYVRAGDFFLKEMRCRRREQRQRGTWRLWSLPCISSTLIDVLCGYGERPSRVLLWGAVVVLIFAGLHSHLGIATDGPAGAIQVHDAGHALYFSIVTFTTLGYGDFRPSPGWGQAFSNMEALMGALLMSLFLVCVVRKFSR